MLINDYCTTYASTTYASTNTNTDQHAVSFTRPQASDFAKKIANDFNPLHDVDAKRFCVPGDLLFSLVLANYGISQHMSFTFAGMVTDEVKLILPEPSPTLSLTGSNDKEYMSVTRSGENCIEPEFIDNLTRSYVTFSGQTFPHILVPLLEQKNVMINPERPMVMYQSMLIDLQEMASAAVELELDAGKTHLEVHGKRGNVCLAFNLKCGDTLLGRGEKHMIVGGLRPFEKPVMDSIIADYAQWKQDFAA